MCHDDPFKDEQCMKREKLGSNEFVWVRKCKGAKVCVDLPYYGGMIGACSIKVRSHYDGESCANGNKCTSGICDGTKCKGLIEKEACIPGLGQCKKGLLCRKAAQSSSIFTCLEPVSGNTDCGVLAPTIDKLKLKGEKYISNTYRDFFHPAINVCKLGQVCNNNKCVKIGSVSTGASASNPLACSTGLLESNACASSVSLTTSKGATITDSSKAKKAFEEWKKAQEDNNMDDEDAIYEAYRYTRKKKKINELFFNYTHAGFIQDADECAYDYMWKQASSSSLKFSLMILVLALLF
jgi:hypothetical protein